MQLTKTTFDLGDNQTIGIAWKASADSRIQRVLDPLHVVVGNLYLTSLEATNGPTNYLVILEEIKVANADKHTVSAQGESPGRIRVTTRGCAW